MATRIEEVRVDDIDGTKGAKPVTFAYDGTFYTIDLSKENAKELKQLLKPYIKAATPTDPPAPKNEIAEIRRWAKDEGIDVGDRGRIHASVIEKYRNAQQKKAS